MSLLRFFVSRNTVWKNLTSWSELEPEYAAWFQDSTTMGDVRMAGIDRWLHEYDSAIAFVENLITFSPTLSVGKKDDSLASMLHRRASLPNFSTEPEAQKARVEIVKPCDTPVTGLTIPPSCRNIPMPNWKPNLKIPATSIPVPGVRSAEEATAELGSGPLVPLPTFGNLGGQDFLART